LRLALTLGIAEGALVFGRVAHGHEGLSDRIDSLSARIAGRPLEAALWLERGECFRLQRLWRAALADLARAQRLDPGLAAVHLARARLFVDARESQRALEALDEFERRRPDHAEAVALRARALALAGWGAEAAVAWDRAIGLSERPEPDFYFARAELRFALGGEERRRAIAGLDEGAARLGGAMQLEELALRLESELGDWDAALRRVERLRASSPRPEIWRARAADLLERAGRRADALAATDAALAEVARTPARLRGLASTRALQEELQRRRARLSSTTGKRDS
jgi:tetratricopeptide (TPR) repeat protein